MRADASGFRVQGLTIHGLGLHVADMVEGSQGLQVQSSDCWLLCGVAVPPLGLVPYFPKLWANTVCDSYFQRGMGLPAACSGSCGCARLDALLYWNVGSFNCDMVEDGISSLHAIMQVRHISTPLGEIISTNIPTPLGENLYIKQHTTRQVSFTVRQPHGDMRGYWCMPGCKRRRADGAAVGWHSRLLPHTPAAFH